MNASVVKQTVLKFCVAGWRLSALPLCRLSRLCYGIMLLLLYSFCNDHRTVSWSSQLHLEVLQKGLFPFTSPLMEGQKSRKRGRPPGCRRTYMTQDSHGNVVRKPLSPFKVQKQIVGGISTSDQRDSLLGQHKRLTGNISKQPHLADGVGNRHSPVSQAQHQPPAHCQVNTSKQNPQELITCLRKTPLKDAVLVPAPTCVAKQDKTFHLK